MSSLTSICNSLLATATLCAAVSAQTPASYTFGDPGCNGNPFASCLTLNDVNPTHQIASLPNEYAYPVINTAAGAIQVVGFEIYTVSNTGLDETGNTGICWDLSGQGATALTQPASPFAATGTITVGGTVGWYGTTLVPPVTVPAGAVFWFTADAFSRIAPPQHTSGGATGPTVNYYRRPSNGNVWTSSVSVARQIFRIHCATDTPSVPYVTASAPPVLGQSINLTLGGGTPSTSGFFVFSGDQSQWFGLPTPVDAVAFGAPNCSLYCSWDVLISVPLDAQGQVSFPVTIPNMPSLSGATLYNQGIVLAPAVNPLNLLFSNLGIATFGT